MGDRTERRTLHFNSQGFANWKQWPRSAYQDCWLPTEAWQGPFFSFPVTAAMIWLIFLEIFLACTSEPWMLPKLIEMHKWKLFICLEVSQKLEALSEVSRCSYTTRQLHCEQRPVLPVTPQRAKYWRQVKEDKERVTAGWPQGSRRLGWHLQGHPFVKAKWHGAGCKPPSWLHGICRDDSCVKSKAMEGEWASKGAREDV